MFMIFNFPHYHDGGIDEAVVTMTAELPDPPRDVGEIQNVQAIDLDTGQKWQYYENGDKPWLENLGRPWGRNNVDG